MYLVAALASVRVAASSGVARKTTFPHVNRHRTPAGPVLHSPPAVHSSHTSCMQWQVGKPSVMDEVRIMTLHAEFAGPMVGGRGCRDGARGVR